MDAFLCLMSIGFLAAIFYLAIRRIRIVWRRLASVWPRSVSIPAPTSRHKAYGIVMGLFLSHTTALEALRGWGLRHRLAKGERCDVPIPTALPAEKDLERITLHVPTLAATDRPVEVIVSTGHSGARAHGMFAHVTKAPLPAGSAVRISDDVVCSAPELVAVQMAPSLTPLELLCLLSELLGLYAICPGAEGGMFERSEPLTTPERLRAYLDALGPRPGTGLVRHALARACVRSGSPRETKLALRLSLKPGLGGYGLGLLAMNEPVVVERIYDPGVTGIRRPDILVGRPGDAGPSDATRFVAVEYNGRHHDLPARITQDANRSNELRARNIPEYVIRREQYDDLDYMDGLVARIRKNLGLPRIGMTKETAAERRRLRQWLYEELEHIDGVHWTRRAREKERKRWVSSTGETTQAEEELVPVEAYGLA